MSLQTPVYDLNKYPSVYEPSEDTFLFLDSLETELGFIKKMNPTCVLEVGSGSGINITALGAVFKNKCAYFGTDVNIESCSATRNTSKLNKVEVHCLGMDLIGGFKENMFNLVIFNPPYVATDSSEIGGNGISRAWAGGKCGREVIDKFLVKLPCILSENGVCYMVVIKENKPEEIGLLMCDLGYNTEILNDRKILGEHLFVLKFCKNTK